MFLEVIFGSVYFIGIFLWWWQRSAKLYWEKNGVSYIPGPPLIGVLKEAMMFKKNIAEIFFDLYNHEKCKDDPITGAYFFHKRILIVRHPELIKNIFIRDFSSFVDRPMSSSSIYDGIGYNSLLLLKGDRWRTIRQKLSPLMTTIKLKNLFHLTVDVGQTLDQKLSMEIGDKPREYELKELASLFTTDAITTCAFGINANCLLNPNAEFHKNAIRIFEFTWKRAIEISSCFLFPELAKLLRFTLFSKETNDFLRSSINHVMAERTKSGEKRKDLIDVLIEMKNENPKYFNEDTLVAQAATFLAAGYESSSSTISFTLFELAHRPEIQEKVRKEIRDYQEKHGALKYETINELEYMNCVIQEVLRLYSPAPYLDRICLPADGSDSYSLEPYHKFAIPRGMSIYVPIFGIHRDPKYFPNPSDFIPERFSTQNWNSENQYKFLAFSLGPRNCIGYKLGMFQIKVALFTILRSYRVEVNERTPKTIEFERKGFITSSKDPLYMNLIRI